MEEEDLRVQRRLDDHGNETPVLICGECGEDWEPPPGEEGFVCFECGKELEEEEAWRINAEDQGAFDEY